ncbi:MAG: GAF domain-containing sensor histidine kinase [Anaerolineae bacterium]|nr:GAF domain-containing sensor histidine kinase [Anaerolineae bacterium]
MSQVPSSQQFNAELQRRNNLLKRLLDVSLILNANLDPQPLLDFIMDAVCEITNCEAASILLYNSTLNELRFVASNSPGVDITVMSKIPVPMEGSIAGQIVMENVPIVISDASADPRIYRKVDESIDFETRSLLGVPMPLKGSVVGVLEAVNKRQGEWTVDDRASMLILASHAAVAINNAQQSEALRSAYDELGKIDKIKSDFIAVASHELRTPLGVIMGYASFLQMEAQGEASEHATRVLNAALHMRNLIEDLVNLRFLQSHTVELNRERVQAADLLRTAQQEIQALADAKGQSLTIDWAHGEEAVSVDKGKMGMVLENILNNAVKFTPNGGKITLKLETRPREIWIQISDNGMGIPEDQLERIFDKFHQVEDHMTRSYNGMGLGLSIAKGIVDAHGGRLWAESAGQAKGSTFIIALPLIRQTSKLIPPQSR